MGKVKESTTNPRKIDADKNLKKVKTSENVFDLKKAKAEVLQFGLRGLSGEHKEKGVVDMLVRLGAKLPKNKFINYKELQQNRAEEKKQQIEIRKSMEQFGGKLLKKKMPKDNNKKRTKDALSFGRYKDGVLNLPKAMKSYVKNKKS